MPDLLTDVPPTVWEGHEINWDFRPMVKTINEMARAKSDTERAQVAYRAVDRFFHFPIAVKNLPDAFQSLIRFLRAGMPQQEEEESSSGGSGSGEVTYDYAADAGYIVAAFQQAYHIDLTSERVHWWRFCALFYALPEETTMRKIMDIRATDTSELDESNRRRYEEQKARFALPSYLTGVKRIETLQEHENAFFDRF